MQVVSLPSSAPQARVLSTTVLFVDEDGAPLADTDLRIEQVSHSFEFGNIGFDFLALANGEPDGIGTVALAQLFTDVFNTATLPFYWAQFESQRGAPHTERLLATARWFTERGVRLKGHPLAWHTVQPSWLLELDLVEVERLLRERIRREVRDFAGLVDTWDAINEVVIMPVFENGDNGISRLANARGRISMIRMAFEEARSSNRHARLVLNDFDLSSAYECLIEGVLEAGVTVDAIGLQTHMHQGYWGEDAMARMVDRFARYGIPLHLTETSIVSGDLMPAHVVDLNDYVVQSWPSTPDGEARQADEIVRHYRSLVAHPAVEAVTYWGLTDKGAWLGAPIGLVREDGTLKPSYSALRDLIKQEWWVTPTFRRTDPNGRLEVRAFAGDYQFRLGDAQCTIALDGAPTRVQFTRKSGDDTAVKAK